MRTYVLTLSLIALIPLTSLAQIPTYLPDSGLVAWYPFNGNANDQSANSNNGTLNGPVLSSDRFGNTNSAYNFDGTNDYIFISGNSQFDALESLTVSAWYNTNTATSARTLMTQSGLGAEGERFTMRLNLAQVKSATTCSAGWSGTSNHPYNTNTWSHYVFTFDQDKVRVYLDGSIVDSADVPNNTLSPCVNSPLKFGMHWNGDPQWFLGKLDDIAIWDRALTYDEIQSVYGAVNGSIVEGDTAICQGDSMTIQAQGSGLTGYSWSTGDTTSSISVSPTSDTLYYVTLTNPYGSTVDSIQVQVSQIALNYSSVAPECSNSANGSIQLTPSGGIGSYTYSWSNGNTSNSLTDLLEFTGYAVTVTDSIGCNAVDSVFVPEHNDSIQPTADLKDTVFLFLDQNGQALFYPDSADEGSTDNCGTVLFENPAPDTFVCSSGSPVNRTIIISDEDGNLDTGITVVVVSDTTNPIVNCPSDTVMCQGSLISNEVEFSDNCDASLVYTGPDSEPIEVQGDSTFVQTWEVTDPSGNLTVCSRSVDVQSAPPVEIITDGPTTSVSPGIICLDAVTDGQPNAYLWSDGNDTSFACVSGGIVWVQITYSNGCTRSDTMDVDSLVGIDPSSMLTLSVYPNPAKDFLTVKNSPIEMGGWIMMDITGRVVLSSDTQGIVHRIDTSSLTTGTYIISIRTPKGVVNKKFMMR